MGCRIPGGVNNTAEFWDLLCSGKDAITEIPADRWDVDAFYDKDPGAPGKIISRFGGFIEQAYDYDAPFFNISPREAYNLDPQQYLLLEVCWEALENAGLAPQSLDSSRTGVFIGVSKIDNFLRLVSHGIKEINAYLGTGNALCVTSGRIAYLLNLYGPNFIVDTACSSSLVALHLACQSLLNGESSCALCGGVNRLFLPYSHIGHSKANMLAPDGRCKTFDASADGYVRSEGCGMVVLKRLEDALTDKDRIAAVICGSAVNSDGQTSGLTVPSEKAQQNVILQALKNAGLKPEQISYLEAHGTGTTVGDPIEANALGSVFSSSHSADDPLIIGSVKSNVGHGESASGIISLIKSILIQQHRQIPPNLHLNQPNPKVPWDDYPIKVATELIPWDPPAEKSYIGINGFGFSGTNAHIIVGPPLPYPEPKSGVTANPRHILTLSARTEAALPVLAARYHTFLRDDPDVELADICFTANTGRAQFEHRLAVTGESTEQFNNKLSAFAAGDNTPGLFTGKAAGDTSDRMVFLFTGQGSQYTGMGKRLYETQPVFRRTIDQCQEILQPWMDKSLLEVMGYRGETDPALNETAYTQPALFSLEYALFKLWTFWGIKPAAVMGHSIGEYPAACAAGVFSLEDGLRFIAARGQTMQKLCEKGDMLVLRLEEKKVVEIIKPYASDVSLAAVNGPSNIVISGQKEALAEIKTALSREGIDTKYLSVSHAFHSAMMEPMLPEFKKIAAEMTFYEPRLPLCSNLTGKFADAEIATAEYWCRHVLQPVRFADSMTFLAQSGFDIFLELGPSPILLGMGRMCLPQQKAAWLLSLRKGQDDWLSMLDSLAELFVLGTPVDWTGFEQDHLDQRQKAELPTYPFQRRNYLTGKSSTESLLQDVLRQPEENELHPFLGRKLALAGSREVRWEAVIRTDEPGFLNDHKIFGSHIIPATVYWEMALSAGYDLFKSETLALENVSIAQALTLSEGEDTKLQCVLIPEEEKTARFQIYSQASEQAGAAWVMNASGTVKSEPDPTAVPLDLDKLRKNCPKEISVDGIHEFFSGKGLDFGPSFLALKEVSIGKEEVLGRIELPDILDFNEQTYMIHPVLFDSCIRIADAGRPKECRVFSYLPLAIEKIVLHRRSGRFAWAHVRMKPIDLSDTEFMTTDISIFDENGCLVAELIGNTVKKASPAVLKAISAKKRREIFFNIEWQSQIRPQPNTDTLSQSAPWMIIADSQGAGKELSEILEEKSQQTELVVVGKDIPQDPPDPEAFTRLFSAWKDSCGSSRGKVIVLLDSREYSLINDMDSALDIAAQNKCLLVMFLFQALTRAGLLKSPQVWVITRAAQPVIRDWRPLNLVVSPVWGMTKSIALEHPELNLVQIDLAPDAAENEAQDLLEEILSDSTEDHIALRDSGRFVTRLLNYKQRVQHQLEFSPGEPYRLEIEQKGSPDNLQLVSCPRREPGAGEVEILVRATGLNFKDVLNILDMYPGELGPPGGECAGEIVKVGAGVTDFKPGDAVLGFITSSFARYVYAPETHIVKKPDNLNFAEAASIPITFLTSYYCLFNKAKVSAGDRVLIHAAAGGVGLAAIQLAQMAGAEIFATASPGKWPYLKSLGIKHIFNSRTTDFADQILQVTDGEGVDIVLNSLSGEFIDRSFSVLKPAGRFLEIGKRDVWDAEKVKQEKPGAFYAQVDLSLPIQDEPERIKSLLAELMERFSTGKLKPMPLTLFPIEEAASAFRFMQQARHIGKIVITQPEQLIPLRENGTYLITGGLGGLGLKTAAWMAENGAGALALVGRSAPSVEAQDEIKLMAQSGSLVKVFAADVSQKDQISAVIAKIKQSLPPLRGIIHAAGVLDDGIILNLSPAQFARVLAPKISGSVHLHNLTRDLPLDFFVFYSSVSALIDNPGRSSYAAANIFMDSLAQTRWRSGLPGLSINWGPWSDVGMAADLKFLKYHKITPEQGIQTLEDLLSCNRPQEGIFPIDWSKFFERFSEDSVPIVFSELLQDLQKQKKTPLKPAKSSAQVNRIKAAAPEERRKMLQQYLVSLIASVLRLESDFKPDLQQPLSSLGMDSLMATETAHRIASDLEITMPIYEISGDSSIAELVEKMSGQYLTDQDSRRLLFWITGGFDFGGVPVFFLENLWTKRPDKDTFGISIEELAADYAAQIRKYQKKGPYYLGGFSIGGALNLEVARQLEKVGEKVPLLFLLDPATPGEHYENISMRTQRHMEKLKKLGLKGMLKYIWSKVWLKLSKGVLVLLPFINFNKPLPAKFHFHYTLKIYTEAVFKYNPPKYSGRTIIYATKDYRGVQEKKWHSICSDLEMHFVDAEEHLEITKPPWNKDWLEDLKTRISD